MRLDCEDGAVLGSAEVLELMMQLESWRDRKRTLQCAVAAPQDGGVVPV